MGSFGCSFRPDTYRRAPANHESQHGGREPGPVVKAQHRHARDGLQLPNWVCLVSDASDDGFGLAGRPVSDRGVAPHIRGSWFREELGTRSGKVDMHGAASATSFAGSTGDTPIVDTYVLRTYCRIRCYGSWSRRSALHVDASRRGLAAADRRFVQPTTHRRPRGKCQK